MSHLPKALILLFDGVEEMEAIAPIDLLRRAGVQVVLVSCGESLAITGRSGIKLEAEALLADLEEELFDALILPGGPGCTALRGDKAVLQLVRKHHASEALLAAICAAPTVLQSAKVLENHTYTAHFSTAEELTNRVADQPVVQDGHLITSQGAGTATLFALALVKYLVGETKAEEVAKSLSFQHKDVYE